MSRLRVPLVLLIAMFLAYDAYSLTTRANPEGSTPLQVVQTGIASWYGSEEQGKLTASGERFNRLGLTAASRKLPLNSVVRVTNEQNGRSVDVRINDRGPYVHNRVIDVSEAAADRLDMKAPGTVPVKVEMVQPASAAP